MACMKIVYHCVRCSLFCCKLQEESSRCVLLICLYYCMSAVFCSKLRSSSTSIRYLIPYPKYLQSNKNCSLNAWVLLWTKNNQPHLYSSYLPEAPITQSCSAFLDTYACNFLYLSLLILSSALTAFTFHVHF